MKLNFINDFGRMFIPKRIRPKLKSYLWKAGITKEPYFAFGILFIIGLVFSMLLHIAFSYQFFIPLKEKIASPLYYNLILGFGTFLSVFLILSFVMGFIMVLIYFFLDIKIYNRTRKLEDILPDFLETVASNLRGGLSFEKALWSAIKPRFGILSSEIAIVAKKVMTGHDVEAALVEFSQKYGSPMLRRSIDLIVDELKGGGRIADIIDDVVEDLKKQKQLKEEISTSVLSYIIFITAVVIFISPLLFALAHNLLIVLRNVMDILSTGLSSANDQIPFQFQRMSFNPEVFIVFSHIAIAIISIFASMIVSIVEKGSIKGGIKYIPLFLIGSQLFYLVALKIISSVFGQLISF